MPSITKARISSPLEAGASLLDAQLPPILTSALEYVSTKLASRRLHLSLVVVRKDVQIPSLMSPTTQPKGSDSPATPSPSTSPSRSIFSASAFTRTLSKHSSTASLSETSSDSSYPSSSRTSSPAPSSISSTGSVSPTLTVQSPNPWGISLMHADSLTEKAEKILRRTIEKAEKKFSIGSGWLPTTSTSAITNDLIRHSLAQNHILFSSEGLTLLALDYVYSFKCRLNTYSSTLTAADLTHAVDELRRLVLTQHGQRITRGHLMRAYAWLGISFSALMDVNEGYKTAYGGRARQGGIVLLNEERRTPGLAVGKLQTSFAVPELRRMRFTSTSYGVEEVAMRTPELVSSEGSSAGGDEEEEVDVDVDVVQFGESARGREDRGPHRRGPVTPNGYEDITPVTKGEWLCLMVGDGWNEGRRVAVETW